MRVAVRMFLYFCLKFPHFTKVVDLLGTHCGKMRERERERESMTANRQRSPVRSDSRGLASTNGCLLTPPPLPVPPLNDRLRLKLLPSLDLVGELGAEPV